jgi:hypothetical protein
MPSLDQLNAALLKADAAGDTQNAQIFADQIKTMQAQEAPPQLSPQDAARQRGIAAGKDESSPMAALGQFAHQATFGGQNYADAAAQWLRDHLTGKQDAASFDEDLAEARGRSEGEITGSPWAGTAGGIVGGVAGGGAAAGALRGTRFARALAAQPGQKVANVAKSMATGAALGGATAVANGETAPNAVRTAAISAVATPVASKVAGFALSKLQPAAARAYQTLADTIGETPQTLQNAYNTFQQLTGRIPSMAELMGLRSQGKLRDLAAANPRISEAAITASNMGGRPLHEQLGALNAQGATMPQTARELTDLRDTEMTTHMDTPHPQTGTRLRDTPVPDPTGIMLAPHVELALRPNTQLNARLGNVGATGLTPIMERIEQGQATLDDVETVRKALRDMQSQLMRPRAGSPHSRDPLMAREFGDIAMQVEGLGSRADPDYGLALGNYRAGSHYIDSFEHGMSGKAVNDVPTDDSMLSRSLAHPAGERGYQHGNALRTAQDALDAIAPGRVKTTEGGPNASHAAQAAMAASSGGVSGIYHLMRSIPVVGDRVPDRVQRVIAEQLFDPRRTQQGINNLRRAGVQNQDIRAMAAAIGGTTGQKIADYVSQQGQ